MSPLCGSYNGPERGVKPQSSGAGGAVIMIIMSMQLLHVKPSLTPQLKRISKNKDDDEDDDVEGYRNDDDDVDDKNDEGSYR